MKLISGKQLKGKIEKVLFILSFVVIFYLIFILNKLYPLLGEDWDYSFICSPFNDFPERVSSLKDILVSQHTHYLFWGGRSVTHAIAQFLLMIGERWHDILNSIAFVLSIYMIYRMINKDLKLNLYLFWLVASSVWLCTPDIISTTLWLTYSANYLWSILIIIIFIYPYYIYYIREEAHDSFGKMIIIFLAGIIAGWTNENMSIALIFFLEFMLILLRYQKIEIPKWMYFGIIGVVIGCVLLLVAPGNYVRLGTSSLTDSLSISIVKERLYNIIKTSVYYLLPLLLTYIAVFIYFVNKIGLRENRKTLLISLLFFLSALVSIFAMVASPEFPIRVLSGTTFFLLIAIGILYAYINQENKMFKWLNPLLIIVLLFIAVPDYVGKYQYTKYLNQFWKEREIFVEEQKRKGILNIEITGDIEPNDKFIVYDLEYTPEKWINKVYARYYGLNTIIKVKK